MSDEKKFGILFQMLVYLFYFLPYYVYAIYRLLYPGPTNGLMKDLAVFHAGAAAQVRQDIFIMSTMGPYWIYINYIF